jgi:hypothetical protein
MFYHFPPENEAIIPDKLAGVKDLDEAGEELWRSGRKMSKVGTFQSFEWRS